MNHSSGVFAHTTLGPIETWEPLERHLREVGEGDPAKELAGAAEFAAPFQASDWGRVLGWWHDLGKYSKAFQEHLRVSAGLSDLHADEMHGRVDHSSAGAKHAVARFGRDGVGRLLAYCIAGHHAGLPNWESGLAGLRQRLDKAIEPIDGAPRDILELPCPSLPMVEWGSTPAQVSFRVAFFVRMLFSCLVDADFLATERFMKPEQATQRAARRPSLDELLQRLNGSLERFNHSSPDTPVNQRRREVLEACRSKAELPPGLFSLNVPTGGGKTLSSLAFALNHARCHSLRRVIYAVPFTSIIEQTAKQFRDALGDLRDAVLEHHSGVDAECAMRTRLAAENWDAPLIVTTNVQFLESLFASRTSRCRKLHRIARSVIILDEAQTLPPELLTPTLAAIDELARNYGCTIVLCTATQPSIERRERFEIGLENVTPIIEDPIALHEALRRTEVQVLPTLNNVDLANRIAEHRQALCIVNSRGHATAVFRELLARRPVDECVHLSALMCAAHRSQVIQDIRRRLDRNEPCCVVSTQIIEAGVDVDFPVVFRALAGLDSIAQAAGRCNREGKRASGPVFVFEYDARTHRAPPFIKSAAEITKQILPEHRDDLLSPRAIEAYFRLRYWRQGDDDGRGWDRGRGEGRPSVMECFGGKGLECQFRAASERYRLIEDAQTPIVVPWGDKGRELCEELASMPEEPNPGWLRNWARRAQRYTVGVFEHSLKILKENSVLIERHGWAYLSNARAYDEKLGLTFEAVGLNPEDLVQ